MHGCYYSSDAGGNGSLDLSRKDKNGMQTEFMMGKNHNNSFGEVGASVFKRMLMALANIGRYRESGLRMDVM